MKKIYKIIIGSLVLALGLVFAIHTYAGVANTTDVTPITSNQTNATQKTKIVDSLGNQVDTLADEAGHITLRTGVIQDVHVIPQNSTTTNLGAGATYTGTSVSTLGVVGIQVSLKTDVNCTVYIDQSPDGTNWDLFDQYDYTNYTNNFGVTVQAINSFFRVRVTNTSATSSTYFRLQSVLAPVVEALPRSLDNDGYLKTSVQKTLDVYGFDAENTPEGESRTVTPVKLAGVTFVGNTLDSTFWNATSTNGATSISSSSVLTLDTNTTANASTSVNSVRVARFVTGAANHYHSGVRFTTAGTTNNIRREGAFTLTDGAFFQLSGNTFSIVTRRNSVDTVVNNGSFNGKLGSTITLDTNFHTYEIYYDIHKVYFVFDDKLLHTVTVTTTPWVSNPHFQVRYENTNINGATSSVRMEVMDGFISRLGNIQTSPAHYHTVGAGTYFLKVGPGLLHTINVNGAGPVGSSLTIYDNTTSTGTTIASIDSAKIAGPVSLPYNGGLNFDTGLTIVQVGTFDTTIIYE